MGELTEEETLHCEIMLLAYLVNTRTEYCVFCDYHGHVSNIQIEIAESKDRYQNKIASTEFYTNGKYQPADPLRWLKSKRDHLERILTDGEISFDGMEEVIHQRIEHAF